MVRSTPSSSPPSRWGALGRTAKCRRVASSFSGVLHTCRARGYQRGGHGELMGPGVGPELDSPLFS